MPHRTRRVPRLVPLALAAVIGVGVAVGTDAPASAAPSTGAVTITAPAKVTDGATFDATVTFAAVADVYAYEATFAFDPAVVSYVSGSATAPAGGFDTVSTSSGSVDVVHTRLGTSPALSGTVSFTLRFTAEAPGATAIALSSLRLIDPATGSTTATDVAATPPITVAAAATPPGSTPPGSTPTTAPAGNAGDGPGTASGSTQDSSLASTGQDVLPWLGGGTLLLLLGVGAVLLTAARRRHAGGAR